MANIITNEKVNDNVIQMSNVLTSVFLETICLAGADFSSEKYQKDLMIWFAQHDWFIRGIGVEGFDVCEIIWDEQMCDEQKKFIIKVIDLAINKTNWNLLSYLPNKEWISEKLLDFRTMISAFNREHIELEHEEKLFDFDGEVKLYEKCKKHKVFKHWQGCIICNNEVEVKERKPKWKFW